MDALVGIQGDGFVVLLADTNAGRSIIKMKNDFDKIMPLDSHKALAIMGDGGDNVQFGEYIRKNMALYAFRNDIQLSTHATVNFVRSELAKFLRKSPYQVNCLLAGWDKEAGANMYWLDYLGAYARLDYAAQGYAAMFLTSLFDREWRKGMKEAEALKLMKMAADELNNRLVLNYSVWTVKIIDKNGVRVVELPKK